jgi:dipeptidyl aminopeptidase/acylaminoacyl peptidase
MASLDEHFRALTRVRPPDPWPELGEREPAAPTSRPAVTRLAAAAVALAVAAAGLTVAVRAFRAERPASLAARIENGLIAFARGGTEAGLYAMNPNGTGVTRLTSKAVDNDPAWSPDGSSIAFVRGFDAGDAGIYVIDADGTGARRLTDGGGLIDFTDDGPVWSPDRTRIAFARGGREPGAETGNGDIYVVNVDGTNLVQLTNDPVIQSQPAWSPDGSRIAFVHLPDGMNGRTARICTIGADGTGIRCLSNR